MDARFAGGGHFGPEFLDYALSGMDFAVPGGAAAKVGGHVLERAAAREVLQHGGDVVGKGSANPKVQEALRKGQQAHTERQYSPGFEKEVSLPSGKRMDAYNRGTREVIELKPNNPRAIRRGERQVEEYCKECDKVFGPGHRGRVDTY